MTTNERKNEIQNHIIAIYMRDCYTKMKQSYSEAQREDQDWITDHFIPNAVNNWEEQPEYNFYQRWREFHMDDEDILIGVDTICEMISEIEEYWLNNNGYRWNFYRTVNVEKIMNTYAYITVEGYFEDWETRLHFWDLDDEENEAVEEEEIEAEVEEYNGTKDFPSNETDETCPICLEAYDKEIGRLKDGIRNSNYESNCPHLCCCVCWDKMYKQNEDTYSCPICKRDITDWLKTHYDSDDDICVGCGSNNVTVFDCGGDKGVNMCKKCFGIPDDD